MRKHGRPLFLLCRRERFLRHSCTIVNRHAEEAGYDFRAIHILEDDRQRSAAQRPLSRALGPQPALSLRHSIGLNLDNRALSGVDPVSSWGSGTQVF